MTSFRFGGLIVRNVHCYDRIRPVTEAIHG